MGRENLPCQPFPQGPGNCNPTAGVGPWQPTIGGQTWMAHPGDCAAQVTGQRLTSGSGPAMAPGRPPGLVVAAEV